MPRKVPRPNTKKVKSEENGRTGSETRTVASTSRPVSALAQARRTRRQNRPKAERKGPRQALWWWGGPRAAHQHPIGQPSLPRYVTEPAGDQAAPDSLAMLSGSGSGAKLACEPGLPAPQRSEDPRPCHRPILPLPSPPKCFLSFFFPDRLVGKLRAAARHSLSITVTLTPSV